MVVREITKDTQKTTTIVNVQKHRRSRYDNTRYAHKLWGQKGFGGEDGKVRTCDI